ncbi:MAG: hypothetical protein HYV07_33385 [Deltaproteobacteria bacterium]|nr:hypothetical protein [Deltaproteobacteria bacterium]
MSDRASEVRRSFAITPHTRDLRQFCGASLEVRALSGDQPIDLRYEAAGSLITRLDACGIRPELNVNPFVGARGPVIL